MNKLDKMEIVEDELLESFSTFWNCQEELKVEPGKIARLLRDRTFQFIRLKLDLDPNREAEYESEGKEND